MGYYRPQFEITPRLVNLIAEVTAAREMIQAAAILPQWDIQLRRQARLQMAHHSTAIEGNLLNSRQVAGILQGEDVAARERDKREVINYLAALHLLDQWGGEAAGCISADQLLALHACLMESLLPKEDCGAIRREAVAVFDRENHLVFQSPPAEGVGELLEAFLEWLNGPSGELHPVIVAGLAHYELVRIHPFVDGNGRTARLLATLVLYLRGFDTRRFFALDEHYNSNLAAYYYALAAADRTGDQSGWLEYFAEGVAVSLKKVREVIRQLSLDARLKQAKGPIYLDERQMQVLQTLEQRGRLRIADLQALFGVSREMANRILDPLLLYGLVVRRGLGRATYYELPTNPG